MDNFCIQKKIKKTIEINEGNTRDFTFYAIPYGTVLKARSLGKPISKLLATVLTDTSKDVSVETLNRASDQKDPEGNAYVDQHTTQKEISSSLAALRHKQFSEAIQGLTEAVMSEDVQAILAEIVIKSAKDDFKIEDLPEFHEKMPVDLLIKLLTGAFEASAGGLSDLGKSLFPQLKNSLKDGVSVVKEKMSSL